MLKDTLVRVVARDAAIRAVACVTPHLVEEARRLHGTLPTATAALGRALTAAALMGALLKSNQRIALKFEGNGPLGRLIVEADDQGHVRGFAANPTADPRLRDGRPDVAGAIGRAGLLTVVKDLNLKEPYQGVVALASSEVAEDLAHYLADSEQTPSAVGIGLYLDPEKGVTSSGGFLVQSLPSAEEGAIDRVIDGIRSLGSLSELLREGVTPEGLLGLIFRDMAIDILEWKDLHFRCSCSRPRLVSALASLGRNTLQDLASDPMTSITCEYCRTRYEFPQEEIRALAAAADTETGHA